MSHTYIFNVPNNNVTTIRWFSIALLLVLCLPLGYLAYTLPNLQWLFLPFALGLVCIVGAVWQKKRFKLWQMIAFTVVALGYLRLDNFYLGFAILLLFFLIDRALDRVKIIVNTTQITVQGFLIKRYTWQEMQNIVLKDGLLTIMFNSGKYNQFLVQENDVPVDELIFNEFCTQQLKQQLP